MDFKWSLKGCDMFWMGLKAQVAAVTGRSSHVRIASSSLPLYLLSHISCKGLNPEAGSLELGGVRIPKIRRLRQMTVNTGKVPLASQSWSWSMESLQKSKLKRQQCLLSKQHHGRLVWAVQGE